MTPVADLTLVPSERHADADAGATTLRRFLDRVRAHASPDARLATRAATRLSVLSAILDTTEGDATIPTDRARVARLAVSASEALGSLRDAGATPADVAATGTRRGRFLAAIATRADAALERAGLVPNERALAPSDASASVDVLPRRLRVAHTASVTGSNLVSLSRLHAALRAHGHAGVSIALPRFEAADHPGHRVADRLERSLSALDDAPEIDWRDAPTAARTRIVEARSLEAEARAVARAVADALAEGRAPERIAIAVPPRDETILEPLRAALADAHVPFSEAYGPPIERAPEARAALSLLEMARGRIRRDALVELLGTPGIHTGVLVGDADEHRATRHAARVAARLRQVPLVADTDGALFVDLLRPLVKGEEAGYVPATIERLADWIRRLRAAPDASVLARDFRELVERLRLGVPSAAEVARALAAERSKQPFAASAAIGEGAVAVRAVLEAADELRAAITALGLPAERFGATDLEVELQAAIRGARAAARGAAGRAGAVRVGPPREIAGLDHDLVVVTRMLTSAWSPADHLGLLDEATRARLPERARPLGPRERRDVVDLELAWALGSSAEVLMTYAPVDDEGRDTEPPHAWIETALAAGAATSVEPASRLSGRAAFSTPRAAELAALATGAAPGPDLHPRVSAELARTRFFTDPTAEAEAWSGAIPASLGGALSDAFGGASADRPVAVTSIELAAGCPFRSFAETVLLAKRSADLEDALSPRERGVMVHRALHAAFDAAYALPHSRDDQARLQAAETAIARALELDAPASALRREARERAAADALAVLADELSEGDDVRYALGERRFGAGQAPPFEALAIELGATVFVQGQIDRIDLSTDGARARVVDYKTGSRLPSMKSPTGFQLPLYARAVQRLGAAEVSTMYVGVSRGGAVATSPARKKLTPWLDADLDERALLAADTVRAIWAGHVEPRPRSPGMCKRCESRDLCRRPAVIASREEEDSDSGRGDEVPRAEASDG